jgi:hypothetical protein
MICTGCGRLRNETYIPPITNWGSGSHHWPIVAAFEEKKERGRRARKFNRKSRASCPRSDYNLSGLDISSATRWSSRPAAPPSSTR